MMYTIGNRNRKEKIYEGERIKEESTVLGN